MSPSPEGSFPPQLDVHASSQAEILRGQTKLTIHIGEPAAIAVQPAAHRGSPSSLAGSTGHWKTMDAPRCVLHTASHRGDVRNVACLLRDGATVDERNNKGCTPLHVACCFGGGSAEYKAECIRLLLEAGADVNAVTDKGLTALAIACCWKHAECAEMLMRAGANPNVHMYNVVKGTPTVIEWASKQLKVRRPTSDAPRTAAAVMRMSGTWRTAAAVMRTVRWSTVHHPLFSSCKRARAVRLLILGAQQSLCPLDVWVHFIMPYVLGFAC